jgi:hypothetical protein
VFAVSLPVLVGGAGLGVEVGYWHLSQRGLQTAADLAANAGAVALRSGANDSAVYNVSYREADENGFEPASGAITVNTPPQAGGFLGDARSVEVLLEQNLPRYFTGLFQQGAVTINVRAVANYQSGGEACVLALDTWANDAVIFIGNPTTTFVGCNVMSNSLADDSITIAGSADVTAPCVISAGGTSVTADLTLTSCTAPLEDMPQAQDPYASLPEPPIPALCSVAPGGGPNVPKTWLPGRYCGGMSMSGTNTLTPGVYVVDGGQLRINSNAVVNGAGVMFFLTNGATVQFNGSAQINLSAMTVGTYAGVLMYGDRDQAMANNTFNGTADSLLTGSLYFPSQKVTHNGNFSGMNGCMRVVAKSVDLQGDAQFSITCNGTGIGSIEIPGSVRLVE